jgi:hypothetical protein
MKAMRWKRGAALVAVVGSTTGCATSLSLTAAPNVDTRGRFGTEERIELAGAVGSEKLRFYGAIAGGAGYLDGSGSGYGLVSPELGFEGGRAVRWSVGGMYAPRFFFRGPVKVAHGTGVAGQVLFRVARASGEDGSFAIGPRLSTEAAFGLGAPDASGDRTTIGIFQLGLVLRWVAFDTTAKSWTR